MTSDLAEMAIVLVGVLLGAVVYLPTGYAVAAAADLFGFRAAALAKRLLIAVPVGLIVLPILDYWAGRFLGLEAMTAVPLLGLVGLAVVTLRERPRWPDLRRELIELVPRYRWCLIGAAACATLIAVCFTDIEIGGTLYMSSATIDYQKHNAVTDSICRTGLPPVNPSFYPGRPLPLYYYYLWFLTSAQVRLLSGGLIGNYSAVLATSIWVGYGVWAAIMLLLRRFPPPFASGPPRRRDLIATVLLALTGLDIVIVVISALGSYDTPRWPLSVEWYLSGIAYWFTLTTWVPHHVTGCIGCLLGMLAVRDAAKDGKRLPRIAFAGAAFASATGMSVWLGLVGVAVVTVWLAGCLARRRWREVGAFVAAGLVAAVLILPFALDLRAAGQEHSSPVALEVRRTAAFEWCYNEFGLAKDSPVRTACNLVVLPACYFLEFGAFAIGAVAYWWFRWREGGALTDEEWFQLCVAAVPLLLCSFLRSAIHNNDFAWRGVMFAQFMAHVWTTGVVGGLIATGVRGWFRRLVTLALGVTATLGFLGVLYEIGATRANVWCDEAADLRAAYGWCRTHTDSRAVFQHYPVAVFGYDVNDVFDGLYGDRQVVLSDGHYGRIYGISEPMYQEIEPHVLRMFDADTPWEEVRDIAFRLKINYIVVRSRAPVWTNRASWVWQRTPVFVNANVRVFAVN